MAAVRLQLVCRTFKMFIIISFVQYIGLVNLGYVLCIFVHVMHVKVNVMHVKVAKVLCTVHCRRVSLMLRMSAPQTHLGKLLS